MAKISPYGIYRAFNLAGTAALDGGKLYTYEAGTTTPKPTYTDASGNTANPNPVILDVNGSARIWLDVGGYKFVLTDKNDVEQFTEDNIDGGGAAGFASQVITTSTGITLTSTYQNTVIVCTQPVTLSLVSAGIAGDGYVAVIINRSSGNVTLAPDGAETINGASSYIVYPNGAANIHTNGIEWYVSADGQKEMQDDEFRILGSVDSTKKLAFEVDGLTTATTRTLTAQDANGTIYITGGQDVAVADGGTGASTALAGFDALKQAATDSYTGVVELSTDAEARTGTSTVLAVTPANLEARHFESAQQTITAAGSLTIAHGLGKVPSMCGLILVCTTAELGYSVNDRAQTFLGAADAAFNFGATVVADATNLNVRFGSSNPTFVVHNKTTGATTQITNASWRAVFTATLN